jgi:hypothetical protein
MRVRLPSRRLLLGALSVVIAASPAHSQVNPDRVTRAQFFHFGDFGNFALINGATNLREASDINIYRTFEDPNLCYVLPQQDRFIFVINNKDRATAGAIWASFVTILYDNATDPNFLNLYRNAGWANQRGQRLAQFERNSDELHLDPRKFLEYHVITDPARREQARQTFGRIASQFHGQLRQRQRRIDSWEYFPRVAGPIVRRLQSRRSNALAVSLYQFQITGRDSPERIAAVEVQRYGSTRFTIRMETPGLDGESAAFERTFATSTGACRRR